MSVAALFLSGCAASFSPEPPADMLVIRDVPDFQAQTRSDDCGGVALASLLSHAGIIVPAATIDAATYDQRLGGTLLADLENFALTTGARPHSGRGDLDSLRQLLRSDLPVLVPIDLGFGPWRRPHYVVLFGFSPHQFLLHLRASESVYMAAEEFDRRWRTMGRLFLYLEE